MKSTQKEARLRMIGAPMTKMSWQNLPGHSRKEDVWTQPISPEAKASQLPAKRTLTTLCLPSSAGRPRLSARFASVGPLQIATQEVARDQTQ